MHHMQSWPKVSKPEQHQNPQNGEDDQCPSEEFVPEGGSLHHQVAIFSPTHDVSVDISQPFIHHFQAPRLIHASFTFQILEADARQNASELDALLDQSQLGRCHAQCIFGRLAVIRQLFDRDCILGG